jgi:hypothetical protein
MAGDTQNPDRFPFAHSTALRTCKLVFSEREWHARRHMSCNTIAVSLFESRAVTYTMDMPSVRTTSIQIEGRTEPRSLKMISYKDEGTHNRQIETEGLPWNLGSVQSDRKRVEKRPHRPALSRPFPFRRLNDRVPRDWRRLQGGWQHREGTTMAKKSRTEKDLICTTHTPKVTFRGQTATDETPIHAKSQKKKGENCTEKESIQSQFAMKQCVCEILSGIIILASWIEGLDF